MAELVIRKGRVIDPLSGTDAIRDIHVTDGRIAAVGRDVSAPTDATVIEAEGRIVTPGWIDLHAHVYWGVTTWGIPADPLCLASGVTTIVDAGSPGWANFPGFLEWIVKPARTRVLTFVNISGIGLTYGLVGEMLDMRYANAELTAEAIRAHPDVAVGVKVRQGEAQVGGNGVQPLRRAVRAADSANTRVMVHIAAGVPLPDVLDLLRPGDIVTHCFQGRGDTIFDENGRLLPEVRDARDRGVLFDVGHGSGSFHYPTGRRAIDNGFVPDVISSDLHSISVEGPVYDMPTTASKFLNLGMSLSDVIHAVTVAPASAIGRGDELGHLSVGAVADLAIFDLIEGAFGFEDTHGNKSRGTQRLETVATIRAGEVWTPAEANARLGAPRDSIPKTVRKSNEILLRDAGIRREKR